VDEQELSVPLDGGALVGHRGGNGRPAVFLHGGPERPALFVHGALDPLPRESSIDTAKLIGGSQVLVVDGSGHFPWLECPDGFREAVVTWLDGRSS
jgi:hypothetical protein